MARPLYPVWCVYQVLRLHRKSQFDLVYSTYDCFSAISAAFLKLMGLKWIADIWDHPELWKETREEDIKKILLINVPRVAAFQIVRRALKYADLVISAIHPSALAKFRISPQKTFAVTNGVDLSITRPIGLKRSNTEFRVVYVGFVMKERGLNLMLHTMAMLKKRIKGLKLILVGDARKEDVAYLDKSVKSSGLKAQVAFLGRQDHKKVLNLIEASDVCLYPFPRMETINCIYPVKIFEYMAMGKAIVATKLKGVSEVMRDGINGLLVDPADPREMADAIFRIYENTDLRRVLEANAKKGAEEYDWNIINGKINKMISSLVK